MEKQIQQALQERVRELLRSVRRAKQWTEEEVLELAYDESHLSGEQLFDYWERKLDATARAAVEAHAAACDFCLHQLAEIGRLVKPWHPALMQLLLHMLGRLEDVDAEAVTVHLEKDRCQRCLRFTQFLMLRTLAEAVKAGQRKVAEAEASLKAAVTAFAPLPAQVGAFDRTTRPPFQLRAQNEDGSLTVVLRETDEGELVVHVQTPDPQNAGKTVHVEVIGKEKSLTAEVVLQSQGEYGCAGRHTFGEFSELAPRLGVDCAVLAAFTEQRDAA